MKVGKISAAVATAVAAIAVLSGCVGFVGTPKAKQVKKQPKVDVAFTVCAVRPLESPSCPTPTPAFDGQLLVAFRVPKGTAVPRKFRPKKIEGLDSLLLTRSLSYEEELDELAPRPKRSRWVGYASNEVKADEMDPTDQARFKVRFRAPKRLMGKRFKVVPVLGYTHTSAEHPAGDPVDCGENPFAFHGVEGVDHTRCIDDPNSAESLKKLVVKMKKKAKKRR